MNDAARKNSEAVRRNDDPSSDELVAIAKQAAERRYNEVELSLGANLIDDPRRRALVLSIMGELWLGGRQHGLACAMAKLR